MRVTFLAHDGFLIELNTVCLLFDWWKEPIPPLPDKPLLVFVSHRHEDHFNPAVFTLADCKADIQFLLGSDFHLTPHNLTKWQLSPPNAAAAASTTFFSRCRPSRRKPSPPPTRALHGWSQWRTKPSSTPEI